MSKNITFRTHLIANINKFAAECSMGNLSRDTTLVDLIMSLSKYREEGVRLTPAVYLFEDVEQALKLIPESKKVPIGYVRVSATALKTVLKKCAPLARNGWNIYVSRKHIYSNFGLFAEAANPLAISIDQTLFTSTADTIKVVKVHQVADDCVEIRNHLGGEHYVFFSNKRNTARSPLKFVDSLVTEICRSVENDIKESVMTLLKKVLSESFLDSHGAIVAVCKRRLPKYLSDGVCLPESIDFAALVGKALRDREELHALNSVMPLLKGMFNSDGIVVFNHKAKVIAYNCFIRLPAQKTRAIVGGARRRAFNALINKLGIGLVAIYMQSQDGLTDYRKVAK